jgi:Ca2+-binding RTX toxin-like protein
MCFGEPATIVGTDASDQITGTPGPDVIVGRGGDDSINARGGDDAVCGGADFDFADGGDGRDRLSGDTGDDTLQGGAEADLLMGRGDVDTLFGERGDDRLFGGPGTGITLEGLMGGPGDDHMRGGPGLDVGLFFDARQGVVVNLTTDRARGDGRDELISIEGALGSNFDDVLIGTDGTNGLFGQAGDDVIRGLGSGSFPSGQIDVLAGDMGADDIRGGDGFDMASYGRVLRPVTVDLSKGAARGQGRDTLVAVEGVFGSNLDDVLIGDHRANAFTGSFGDDEFVGGPGPDLVIFRDVPGPVRANLATGTARGAGKDTLEGIRNLWGSSGPDLLVGDGGDNRLVGWRGDDAIVADEGDDVLIGRNGRDRLDGGKGFDACLSGERHLNCESREAPPSEELPSPHLRWWRWILA